MPPIEDWNHPHAISARRRRFHICVRRGHHNQELDPAKGKACLTRLITPNGDLALVSSPAVLGLPGMPRHHLCCVLDTV